MRRPPFTSVHVDTVLSVLVVCPRALAATDLNTATGTASCADRTARAARDRVPDRRRPLREGQRRPDWPTIGRSIARSS